MRYIQVNDDWIKDTFTGKHYSLKEVVELLNRQEHELSWRRTEK